MEFLKKAIAKQKEEAKISSIKSRKELIMFQLFNDASTVESIEIFNAISSRFNFELRRRNEKNNQESEEICEFLNK